LENFDFSLKAVQMLKYPVIPGEKPEDRLLRLRRESKQRRRRENPDKAKEDWLKYKHGMTIVEWRTILETQENVCAVCQEAVPSNVDHDHKTGKRRGLLCWPCNVAVGHLKDDPQRAIRLANYLETWNSRTND
jgi:hypothetical protein